MDDPARPGGGRHGGPALLDRGRGQRGFGLETELGRAEGLDLRGGRELDAHADRGGDVLILLVVGLRRGSGLVDFHRIFLLVVRGLGLSGLHVAPLAGPVNTDHRPLQSGPDDDHFVPGQGPPRRQARAAVGSHAAHAHGAPVLGRLRLVAGVDEPGQRCQHVLDLSPLLGALSRDLLGNLPVQLHDPAVDPPYLVVQRRTLVGVHLQMAPQVSPHRGRGPLDPLPLRLGLPQFLPRAVDRLAEGHEVRLDLGRAGLPPSEPGPCLGRRALLGTRRVVAREARGDAGRGQRGEARRTLPLLTVGAGEQRGQLSGPGELPLLVGGGQKRRAGRDKIRLADLAPLGPLLLGYLALVADFVFFVHLLVLLGRRAHPTLDPPCLDQVGLDLAPVQLPEAVDPGYETVPGPLLLVAQHVEEGRVRRREGGRVGRLPVASLVGRCRYAEEEGRLEGGLERRRRRLVGSASRTGVGAGGRGELGRGVPQRHADAADAAVFLLGLGGGLIGVGGRSLGRVGRGGGSVVLPDVRAGRGGRLGVLRRGLRWLLYVDYFLGGVTKCFYFAGRGGIYVCCAEWRIIRHKNE